MRLLKSLDGKLSRPDYKREVPKCYLRELPWDTSLPLATEDILRRCTYGEVPLTVYHHRAHHGRRRLRR